MKLVGTIHKLGRFLGNLQIVQCNLQIVQCNLQIGRPIYQQADWQDVASCSMKTWVDGSKATHNILLTFWLPSQASKSARSPKHVNLFLPLNKHSQHAKTAQITSAVFCPLHISRSDVPLVPRCCRLGQCEWIPDLESAVGASSGDHREVVGRRPLGSRTCTTQLRVVINKTPSPYKPGSRTIVYDSLVLTRMYALRAIRPM